jgi:DNA-binding NtrC family response regulator
VVEVLRLAAPRRSTVLIGGATGTGKELAARALHDASQRALRPMVLVNCGAIPSALVESELFGYEKGAFTGAATRRLGRFEQANGGTIFLDEVGELPLPAQVKLLRTLQEGELQRVGASETISVDVRVVAAGNRDLARMVEEGLFREDLFYRLNVVPVRMPSLAERASDIPVLVDRLLERICRAEGLACRQAAPEAVERLRAAAWPGNVRQLENALARAVALSGERRVLAPGDFPLEPTPRTAAEGQAAEPKLPPGGLDYDRAVARFELSLLRQALDFASGNKKRAAELLRVKRTTFAARWKSLGGDSQPNRTAQGVASC